MGVGIGGSGGGYTPRSFAQTMTIVRKSVLFSKLKCRGCGYSAGTQEELNVHFLLCLSPQNAFPPDSVQSPKMIYVTSYWGYQIRKRFAWLPVRGDDGGYAFLRSYYEFRTNTGYDPTGWTWAVHARSRSAAFVDAVKLEWLRSNTKSRY